MRKYIVGIAATFLMGSAIAVPIVLDLTTDDFGGETSFSIVLTTNSGVSIAYDFWSSPTDTDVDGFLGDGFVEEGDLLDATVYQFMWDLGPGDYEFTIVDSFGDGICCEWGDGSYALSVGGVEIGAGGVFGFEETIAFTIEDASVPEPGTMMLFSLGLLGLALSRRRLRV